MRMVTNGQLSSSSSQNASSGTHDVETLTFNIRMSNTLSWQPDEELNQGIALVVVRRCIQLQVVAREEQL